MCKGSRLITITALLTEEYREGKFEEKIKRKDGKSRKVRKTSIKCREQRREQQQRGEERKKEGGTD